MPHLITHRPRVANIATGRRSGASHRAWETINAYCYKLGGLLFVVGSLFFFPALSAYISIGDWLFFIGSVLYLLVTGHDLLEVHKYWAHHRTHTFADTIERIAAWSYVLGTVCFLVGSLCFLPELDAIPLGSWCFIVGSGLFIVGGFVNILQVVEAPSLIYMQLFNVTVAMFLIGSALFVVASVPYLWHLSGPSGQRITAFAAAQFLAASLLFFGGGIVIYYRNLVRHALEAWCHDNRLSTMFIRALRSEIEDKGHFVPRERAADESNRSA
ncbi:YrhK family protein [Salinisphaera sp. Q1T1-3]|uniref:YrhK family protein n=1 Tax=Salinisphaera sp. Q1T1-3 TaxID=2321229 RepID=UPI001314FBF2|nr:YrhK family protein [Salinisphaera sp. Q1T1-3]